MPGHGTIINMSSMSPLTFEFNPTDIKTQKKINYVSAPNIGGAFKKKYFTGFDSKEISFKLTCIDMQSPMGVTNELAYFEQLREPDPGLLGGIISFGNENYPPPQVIFQFGQSFVPAVWDVLECSIDESHFHSGYVRGVLGIPKMFTVDLRLSLDEDNILNKANMIAKKVMAYSGAANSITREVLSNRRKKRKEATGMFPRDNRTRLY